VSLGSDDFFQFLIAYTFDVAMIVFERVYLDFMIEGGINWVSAILRFVVGNFKKIVPKYLRKERNVAADAAVAAADKTGMREIEGVAVEDAGADSVEPILIFVTTVCSDNVFAWYFPYVILLLMQYREEIWLPAHYGIRQNDMVIYLWFQVM
jgi:hypothetical protein